MIKVILHVLYAEQRKTLARVTGAPGRQRGKAADRGDDAGQKLRPHRDRHNSFPTVRLATAESVVGSTSEESYGEIEYSYAGKTVKTRSTSHREALPLLYGLAGRPIPTPFPGDDYLGYPLVGDGALRCPGSSVCCRC